MPTIVTLSAKPTQFQELRGARLAGKFKAEQDNNHSL